MSDINKENCILRCMNPDCYEQIYGRDSVSCLFFHRVLSLQFTIHLPSLGSRQLTGTRYVGSYCVRFRCKWERNAVSMAMFFSLLSAPFQLQNALVTWLLDLSVWQGVKAATEPAERIVRLLLLVGKLRFCALLSDPFNAAKSALLFSPKDSC
jgi:hypothetical protein